MTRWEPDNYMKNSKFTEALVRVPEERRTAFRHNRVHAQFIQ